MNAVIFGTKRAFHSMLRVTRPAVQSYGLTAARFDMLIAILRAPSDEGIRQSTLRRVLGVCAATVSRMLKSLERLLLVKRVRDARDGRQRLASLTAAGLSRIRMANAALVKSGAVQLAIDSAL